MFAGINTDYVRQATVTYEYLHFKAKLRVANVKQVTLGPHYDQCLLGNVSKGSWGT